MKRIYAGLFRSWAVGIDIGLLGQLFELLIFKDRFTSGLVHLSLNPTQGHQ